MTTTRFENSFTDLDWAGFIAAEIESHDLSRGVLLVYDSPEYLQLVINRLSHPENVRTANKRDVTGQFIDAEPFQEIGVIAICSPENSSVTEVANYCIAHPELHQIPFIYKIRTLDSYPLLTKSNDHHDRAGNIFQATDFDDGEFERIYIKSVEAIQPKLSIKDAMDLYQLLAQIADVDGPIVEFGSYEGHSGKFMQLATERWCDKKIYLYDTFEQFPVESTGIDHFWSNTHKVSYDEVASQFANSNVCLVRGDFTTTFVAETYRHSGISFAYVDCDSYRGCRHVLKEADKILNTSGILAVEDYGHSFCLGARIAFDEFYEHHKANYFRFVSIFSGIAFLVRK